ncbi:MAG: PAS domain S-box protein, partial [Methanomassiliicoccales archaeon]|nr:PAS domain S-box protein [Methanomassiliicoccales archaeon]
VQDLRARLEEAEETLRAIRSGEVDALVMQGPQGEQVYTLKGADEPYRVMVEAMTEGALTFSPDGAILYCNVRFAEFLKRPLEQTIGSPLQAYIAQGERRSFAGLMAQSREKAGRREITLQAADGTRLPVLFSTRPLKLDTAEAIAAVVTDLTAVAAAAKARSRLALIVDSSDDAIIGMNLDGMVESWNAAAERLFGYAATEAVGRFFQALIVPPEGADEFTRSLDAIRRGEGVQHVETVRHRKDGTRVDVSATHSPIRDASRRIIGVSTILRDITERKRLEQELREHQEHLEELVGQRTAELEQANARLQELDRLKSMFIASMSHELRTPLHSIIGFTGFMLQGIAGEINDEQRKQLGIVKKSADHLLALINDIIDITKIEAGKVELSIGAVDLGELVRDVAGSFSIAVRDKGLGLSVTGPEQFTVESDRRRLRQALVNLVGNGVKFTERGQVEISLTPREGGAEIAVRDTGVGMRQEDLPRLFIPFGQLSVEGRPTEGTGLGLYLARKVVELLGGSIAVQSQPGAGSTFTVSLPPVPPKEVP